MKKHKEGSSGRIKENPLKSAMLLAMNDVQNAKNRMEQTWELSSADCSESIKADRGQYCGKNTNPTFVCSFMRCPWVNNAIYYPNGERKEEGFHE